MSRNLAYNVLFLCIVLMFACKQNTAPNRDEPKESFSIKVTSAEKQIPDIFPEQKMDFFYPIGEYKGKESTNVKTIILSNQLSKGQNVDIKPIGMLSFEKDTTTVNYILSVPIDTASNDLAVWDFYGFNRDHIGTMNLIEDWFRTNCPLGTCTNFKWNNELKARTILAN